MITTEDMATAIAEDGLDDMVKALTIFSTIAFSGYCLPDDKEQLREFSDMLDDTVNKMANWDEPTISILETIEDK